MATVVGAKIDGLRIIDEAAANFGASLVPRPGVQNHGRPGDELAP